MNHQYRNSFGLFALFLGGLVSLVTISGCVASSEESPCALGEVTASGAGEIEGAWDEDEIEEGEDAPPSEEEPEMPSAPPATPQAMCSPICDPI
ncbi:uncharacterized protein SOCEGT47_080640 [Sorangium cellulosum]|jgi:hypothetical protein|uniref:Uncharacterized protein n=1 Tax=Sorangium cellulosum TaxID=56 RepID=A0A4P2QE74_SORCE|nr:hypothetical protein [Sorangium cellulosum]AUX27473.1 uncharacterized protein SOCEGT47_080640 [Sorangium cellulosum]